MHFILVLLTQNSLSMTLFVLIVVNLVLNYVLVFGKFGFEPMGIAGSATASTIAEIVAFVVFAVYMLFDKSNRKYRLFTLNGPAIKEIVNMFKISIPIVFQSILSIGSWFLFFSFIENIGRQELEISNLLRTVYLILSIPCWGYSTGINTLVSGFIGHKKRQAVIPLIIKTTKLNLATTLLISIPVVLFPEFFLYPLFGKEDMSLIMLSKPYLPMLLLILTVFGIGGIFFNGFDRYWSYPDSAAHSNYIYRVLYRMQLCSNKNVLLWTQLGVVY